MTDYNDSDVGRSMPPGMADDLWEGRGPGRRVLIHIGPPFQTSINASLVRALMRRRKAIAAMWTYDFDRLTDGPWFSYVCDEPDYDLDKIKKKRRYYVRRALEACTVRRVESAWLAEHGYATYVNAATRYRVYSQMSKEQFVRHMVNVGGQRGYMMYGVFVDQALAAYGIVREFDRYLQFSVAKFDPAFSEAYPMYALYFCVSRERLQSGRVDLVDNGQRPLLHDTQIGDFLLRLGFRKAYSRLGFVTDGRLRALLPAARGTRPIWRRVLPESYADGIEGLLEADCLARRTRP